MTVSSARFAVDTSGANSCGTAPFTVAAGATCQITVRWLGADGAASDAAGTDTATLTLQGDMSPATAAVALSGATGATAPANSGGGGCSIGAGTGAADPLLLLMAGLSGLILWRRRARAERVRTA